MRRLEGKVAWVTGGTRGIGEAAAARLADEGAHVVVMSRKQEGVTSAVARLREAGGAVDGEVLHVGDLPALAPAVDRIVTAYGLPDILVNNAATNPYFGPMIGASLGAWSKTFEVNVIGAAELTRLLAERWIAAKRPASVIFLSSILGVQAAPFQGIYGATKAAVISVVKTLAAELGREGIRVNGIAPGLVDTRLAAALTTNPELRARFEERTALGRIAIPEDLAGPIAFLASEDARYVTGHVLAVDGGYLIT